MMNKHPSKREVIKKVFLLASILLFVENDKIPDFSKKSGI